jgi:hypothetical protein
MKCLLNSMKNASGMGLPMLALLAACNVREPSPARFERATGVKLPTQAKVLANKYQNIQQDYSVLYIVQLAQTDVRNVTAQIRATKFYDPNGTVSNEAAHGTVGNYKGSWVRSEKGYSFRGEQIENGAVVTAQIDTVSGVAEFNETSN